MDGPLVDFLEAYPAHCQYDEIWDLQPSARLRVRLCLGTAVPPVEVRSSVLGIVARGHTEVLFIHPERPSGDISHLLLGGRPELEETAEQTLVREVGEESGWRVKPLSIVGFRHLHHSGPPHPRMADRPYPDFLQPIFAATAETYDAGLLLPSENPCELVDADWAQKATRPSHRPLLVAALQVIRSAWTG